MNTFLDKQMSYDFMLCVAFFNYIHVKCDHGPQNHVVNEIYT